MQRAKSGPNDSNWLCSEHQSKNRFDRYLINPQYSDARALEDIAQSKDDPSNLEFDGSERWQA
jgi:hypothetical protein